MADLHIGNHRVMASQGTRGGINTRAEQCLAALKRAVDLSAKCDHLVVLGDLFDVDRPEVALMRATLEILAANRRQRVTLLVGNHDQHSALEHDHALSVAGLLPSFEVVDEPTFTFWAPGIQAVLIPYVPDPRAILEDALHEAADRRNGLHVLRTVLCMHAGLIDARTPPWLRDAQDAVPLALMEDLCDRYSVHAVFTGNWHNRLVAGSVERPIVQCGTLIPTGFDNAGTEYGFVDGYSLQSGQHVARQVSGPRFVTLRHSDWLPELLEEQLEVETTAALYVRVEAPPGANERVRSALGEALIARCAGFEVVPVPVALQTSPGQEAVRIAAQGAGGAEQALREYIGTMVLPEGVDRAGVTRRALEVL